MDQLSAAFLIGTGVWVTGVGMTLPLSLSPRLLVLALALLVAGAGLSAIVVGIRHHRRHTTEQVPWWWYIFPVCLTVIGSIIVYFGLRQTAETDARALAMLGGIVIVTVLVWRQVFVMLSGILITIIV